MQRNASHFLLSSSGTTRNLIVEKWFGIAGDGPVRQAREEHSARVIDQEQVATQREPLQRPSSR